MTGSGGYTEYGSQWTKGNFLILFDEPFAEPHGPGAVPPLRACVRKVRLSQLGHFMMGRIKLGGAEVVLSGAYGNDGLPVHLEHKGMDKEVARYVWNKLVEVPRDLAMEFWKGGGHNSHGNEWPNLMAWAKENLKDLQKPILKERKKR